MSFTPSKSSLASWPSWLSASPRLCSAAGAPAALGGAAEEGCSLSS